jgi:cell division septation protein DedD
MAVRRNRQREETGPGWLATLGGAALLLVLGFGVGLLAGAFWEEPELVMDHLAGRTTELPLAADSAPEPAKAARTERVERVARPLGARGSQPAAPTAEVPVDLPSVSAKPPAAVSAPAREPAPPPMGGFEIQVGAFADGGAAAQLAGELRAGGFSVHVLEEKGPRGVRFRVRVGPVRSREEAKRLAGKLQSDHELPTWILSQGSR